MLDGSYGPFPHFLPLSYHWVSFLNSYHKATFTKDSNLYKSPKMVGETTTLYFIILKGQITKCWFLSHQIMPLVIIKILSSSAFGLMEIT